MNDKKKTCGNLLYPIFLKVDRINILVVGGGNVGLEKTENLLKNDPNANITLVGTSIKQEIKQLAKKHPSIVLKERPFKKKDLKETELLILATEKRKTNKKIRDIAKKRQILTNVADTPDLCDFYLGSTVKKGDLKIGISTNGKSPTFAKRFRQVLEDTLPEDTDSLLQNLKSIRDSLKGNFGFKVKKLNEYTADLVKNNKKE